MATSKILLELNHYSAMFPDVSLPIKESSAVIPSSAMKATSAVLLILSVFALGQCDFASTTVGPGNDECRDLLPR